MKCQKCGYDNEQCASYCSMCYEVLGKDKINTQEHQDFIYTPAQNIQPNKKPSKTSVHIKIILAISFLLILIKLSNYISSISLKTKMYSIGDINESIPTELVDKLDFKDKIKYRDASNNIWLVYQQILNHKRAYHSLPESIERIKDLMGNSTDINIVYDPFSSDKCFIKYKFEGNHFKLYSIGPDRDDDGGIKNVDENCDGDIILVSGEFAPMKIDYVKKRSKPKQYVKQNEFFVNDNKDQLLNMPIKQIVEDDEEDQKGYFTQTTPHFKVIAADKKTLSNISREIDHYYLYRIIQDFRGFEYNVSKKKIKIKIYKTFEEYTSKTVCSALGIAIPSEKAIYTFEQENLELLILHELSHLMFEIFLENKVDPNISQWLNEGVAIYHEMRKNQELKKQRYKYLEEAFQQGIIIPFSQLPTYPFDTYKPGTIDLWYAEAGCIVDFLIEKKLLRNFVNFCSILKNTNDFDKALQNAYPNEFNNLDDIQKAFIRENNFKNVNYEKENLVEYITQVTPHFNLIAAEKGTLRNLTSCIERYYNSIINDIKFYEASIPKEKIKIKVYRNSDEYMNETMCPALGIAVPSEMAIYTFQQKNLDLIILHELSHLMFEIFLENRVNHFEIRWLSEGIAVYQEMKNCTEFKGKRYRLIGKSFKEGNIIPFSQLPTSYFEMYTPGMIDLWYTEVGCIVDFLINRRTLNRFYNFCSILKNTNDFNKALHDAYANEFNNLEDIQKAFFKETNF